MWDHSTTPSLRSVDKYLFDLGHGTTGGVQSSQIDLLEDCLLARHYYAYAPARLTLQRYCAGFVYRMRCLDLILNGGMQRWRHGWLRDGVVGTPFAGLSFDAVQKWVGYYTYLGV
jgi:hypothetical protein